MEEALVGLTEVKAALEILARNGEMLAQDALDKLEEVLGLLEALRGRQ